MADHDLATIDNPSSALTDFTLIVNLANISASWWAANDTAVGAKGRVFKADGTTELAADWIDFDNGANTGRLRVKWSGTLAASGTQELWIEPPLAANSTYGAADTYGSDNAYDANWEGYWPLGGGTDRTSHGVVLTAAGAPTVGGVAGQIGAATDLNGTTQEFTSTAAALIAVPNSNFTIFAWFNHDLASNDDCLLGWDGTDDFVLYANDTDAGNGDIRIFWRDNGSNYINKNGADLAGSWHQTTVVRRGNTDHEAYTDGLSVATSANNASGSGPFSTFGIGTRGNASQWFDGQEQEVQLHSTNRADPWISQEHAQTNDNANFYTAWTWVPVAGGSPVASILQQHAA